MSFSVGLSLIQYVIDILVLKHLEDLVSASCSLQRPTNSLRERAVDRQSNEGNHRMHRLLAFGLLCDSCTAILTITCFVLRAL